LDKLEKAGLLSCSIGEPTSKRGGKAVKFYSLSQQGFKALERNKKVSDLMWREYSTSHPKKLDAS